MFSFKDDNSKFLKKNAVYINNIKKHYYMNAKENISSLKVCLLFIQIKKKSISTYLLARNTNVGCVCV